MTNRSFMAMRRSELLRRGDADYLRKRREILDGAAEVFRRKGFHQASVADIATQAKIDRATVYLYIASKEEAFQDIIQDAITANVQMVSALKASKLPVPDRIASLIVELLKSYSAHYPFLFVYVQENMSHVDPDSEWASNMGALGRRFADDVTEIVQQGIDDGSVTVLPGANAKLIAFALIGLCNWAHRWFTPTGACSAEQIGKAYANMVLNGLATAPVTFPVD